MSENVKIGYGLTGAPGGEVRIRAYRPTRMFLGKDDILAEGTILCLDLAHSHETAVWLEPGCMEELSDDDVIRAMGMAVDEAARRGLLPEITIGTSES